MKLVSVHTYYPHGLNKLNWMSVVCPGDMQRNWRSDEFSIVQQYRLISIESILYDDVGHKRPIYATQFKRAKSQGGGILLLLLLLESFCVAHKWQ